MGDPFPPTLSPPSLPRGSVLVVPGARGERVAGVAAADCRRRGAEGRGGGWPVPARVRVLHKAPRTAAHGGTPLTGKKRGGALTASRLTFWLCF